MSLATQRRGRDAEFTYSSLLDTDFYVVDGPARVKGGKIARPNAIADVLRRSANVIVADFMEGDDLGEQINNAMDELDDEPGEVWTFGGDLATRITITSLHGLKVLGHITVSAAVVVNGVGAEVSPITMQDHTWLCGVGPYGAGVSSIQESSHATTWSLINADGLQTASFAASNTDIHVFDLEIKGYPGHSDDPGGRGAIHLGNCIGGSVNRVLVTGPMHQLVCGCGGGPSSGNHAEDIIFDGNRFLDCNISLWVISGKNIHLINNKFRRCRTPIDLEPNDSRDILENIHVCNNEIDFRGIVGSGGGGITVHKSFMDKSGPFVITGNVIHGANLDSGEAALIPAGITTYGAADGEISGNKIYRTYGYGIGLATAEPNATGGGRWNIHDNDLYCCGGSPAGGGGAAIQIRGVGNRVAGNRLHSITGIDSDSRVVEHDWFTTVNTSGTAVTATAGAPFAAWQIGMAVEINGVTGFTIVATGTGGTGLAGMGCTVSPSAGTQSAVTLTFRSRNNRHEFRDGDSLGSFPRHSSSQVLQEGQPDPAAVLKTSLTHWLGPAQAYLYQTETEATPVTTAAQAVGRRHDRGPSALHRTQATASARPTWQSGPAVRYDGGDWLAGTALSVAAGPFTIYAVGIRTANNWFVLGHNTSTAFIGIYTGSAFFVTATQSINAAYTGATGLILARWRRDAADSVKFAATGMAEVAVGTAGSAGSYDAEGGRGSGGVSTEFTSANNDHRLTLVASADLVTDGRDAAIRAYIWQQYGVGL